MATRKEIYNAQLGMVADWGDEPIEELTRLINRRINEMEQNAEHATIGTAITALRSLRAATAVAKKKAFMGGFTVEKLKGLYGAWRTDATGKRVRCVRRGKKQTDPSIPLIAGMFPLYNRTYSMIWMVDKNTPQMQCHVFLVKDHGSRNSPDAEHYEQYYVVAKSKAGCRKAVKQRRLKRIGKYRYLARNAITVAMQQLAKKSPGMQGSQSARRVANMLSKTNAHYQGRSFIIDITDNLDYAALAVKGGEAGVKLALAKAANKIAGNLMLYYKNNITSKDPVGRVPYPELLREGV